MTDIERFDPSMDGKIAYEHWHRYALCRHFTAEAAVLDVACGEGYGARFLAQTAAHVTGLDLDAATIAQARVRYRQCASLSFEVGDCRSLPFADARFDCVVSMETLEHIVEQEQFVAEVKRVLRPRGLFVVSTPNRPVYSQDADRRNPFHLAELDEAALTALLRARFEHVELVGQRLYLSSLIGPMGNDVSLQTHASYDGFHADRGRTVSERVKSGAVDVERPEYLIALCSDERIACLAPSIFFDVSDDLWQAQEKKLRWASQLHREDEALRAQLCDLKQEHDETHARLSAARADVRRANAFVDRMARDRDELAQHVEGAGRELTETAAALAQAHADRRQAHERAERHLQELVEARREAANGHYALDGLREALDAYQIAYELAQADLAYVGSALDTSVAAHEWVATLAAAEAQAPDWSQDNPRWSAVFRRRRRVNDRQNIFTAALSIADAARDRCDYSIAAQAYREALGVRCDEAPTWIQYGHMLKESGDSAGAIAAYLRARTLAPDSAEAEFQLAHGLRLVGRPSAALDAYERACRLDPSLQNLQADMEAIALALERDRLSDAQQGELASACDAMTSRAWRTATQTFARVLRAHPRLASAWVQYGHALKELGHVQAAVRAYRSAIEIRPLAADPHLHLGHALTRLGQRKSADAAFRRARELNPNLNQAQIGLTDGQAGRLQDATAASEGSTSPARNDLFDLAEARCKVRRRRQTSAWPPDLVPVFWLTQSLRDLLVDRGDELVIPHISYLMGLIERFGERPDAFDLAADKWLLLGRLKTRAAARACSAPRASIIVPTFNNLVYTLTCVASILEHDTTTRYEILIGDDRSQDEVHQTVASIGGCVRVIRHAVNLGFLANCNTTAALARGDFVVFLNNDTIVLPQWLDALIETFDRHPSAGFVGSKLINGDGSLQEAGGVFWADGSAWNFGRGQDPRAPEFNYVKDVDYCSGASVALPRDLWDALGGFDPLYSPAYCEDADIAFRVRALGRRTLYQPLSALIHHEGRSHGRDDSSGVKAYQPINLNKFYDRWRQTLEREHFPNGESVFVARDRTRFKPHVLVIDHYVPQFDRDAGSRAMDCYIRLFQRHGFHVTLWPDNLNEDRDYARIYQGLGVEVIYSAAYAGRFASWLDERGAWFSYAIVSRPHIADRYFDSLRRFENIKIIYYGHDIHFLRLLRQHGVAPDPRVLAEAETTRRLEERAWRQSDVVVYFSDEECEQARQLSHAGALIASAPLFTLDEKVFAAGARRLEAPADEPNFDLLFVGGFSHGPNLDGVLWFVENVLPDLVRKHPRARLRIAGSNPPEALQNLASDGRVEVLGRVDDDALKALYSTCAAAVVPLRYGAGVKGKLIEALSFGTPVVSTAIGVQGVTGAETFVAIANTAEEFAAAASDVCVNRRGALAKARVGLSMLRERYSEQAALRALEAFVNEFKDINFDERGRA